VPAELAALSIEHAANTHNVDAKNPDVFILI
jgi:hypothetical protein